MTADMRPELLHEIAIKLAIMRQQKRWVLRDLTDKNRLKQEVAQREFLSQLESCFARYEVKISPDWNPAPKHSGPKNALCSKGR